MVRTVSFTRSRWRRLISLKFRFDSLTLMVTCRPPGAAARPLPSDRTRLRLRRFDVTTRLRAERSV